MRFLFSFFVILSGFQVYAQQTLTPELLWKLRRISGGTVSPDGKFLLYSQRVFNMSENRGNTDLFAVELKTGQIRQLTSTPFSEMEAQ